MATASAHSSIDCIHRADDVDARFLHITARLALRGHGGAEPNPLVGCVIVQPGDHSIVGWGYHRQCGREHAEIHALQRAGGLSRGATAYVTLEPCNHTGRTGPCTAALIDAGIRRVVFARRDPNPISAGGADALRRAGVAVDHNETCDVAVRVGDPFVRRITTGLPWIIAKWAQTIDGRIATRTGESQWISSAASRRLVHRERGRVDAILTGIGTVLRDDPTLTARNARVRRVALRVVCDALLQTPLESRLAQTAHHTPTIIITSDHAVREREHRFTRLSEAGVRFIATASSDDRLNLGAALGELAARFDVTNVLVEGGAGLIGQLFAEGLVSEAWVFIAPMLLGDDEAAACVRGRTAAHLADGVRLQLRHFRRRAGDIVARYSVEGPATSSP